MRPCHSKALSSWYNTFFDGSKHPTSQDWTKGLVSLIIHKSFTDTDVNGSGTRMQIERVAVVAFGILDDSVGKSSVVRSSHSTAFNVA